MPVTQIPSDLIPPSGLCRPQHTSDTQNTFRQNTSMHKVKQIVQTNEHKYYNLKRICVYSNGNIEHQRGNKAKVSAMFISFPNPSQALTEVQGRHWSPVWVQRRVYLYHYVDTANENRLYWRNKLKPSPEKPDIKGRAQRIRKKASEGKMGGLRIRGPSYQ